MLKILTLIVFMIGSYGSQTQQDKLQTFPEVAAELRLLMEERGFTFDMESPDFVETKEFFWMLTNYLMLEKKLNEPIFPYPDSQYIVDQAFRDLNQYFPSKT